ncbi:MAG: alginate lyase family protein [Clostridia bacterium]|nr:alginate lyase family protein [Clostridia bacterium]
MFISDEKFFCEELDRSIPGLEGIDLVFRRQGIEAAEKRFAHYIRSILRPDDYLKTPIYDWDSEWIFRGKSMLDAAEDILNGVMCSAGGAFTFPDAKIQWESNPTYNQYSEWTWQLSRHHQWRCLGYCYRENGDERYAKLFVDHLMSWCEQAICPENESGYSTKCWRTIEAGIRMRKNWNYAIHCFYRSPHVTDHVLTTFMKSVWEHGYRLSTAFTSGNWLIMEMVGLAHISILYPVFVKTAEWRELSIRKLSEELDIQIYPDGFQYELSTNYHNVIIHNYDMLLYTAHIMGTELPKEFTSKLESLFELDIKVVCPDGRYPDLNDGNRSSVKEWCEIGSRYFPDNPQIKYFATDGADGKLPEYTDIALPYSGQAYMRTGWKKDAIWFFMDAGPFGKAHQHEDKLNVLMYAYGKAVLPDSGNYAYDTSDMRRFVLSTYSHNCALIDGKGQNRRARFSWNPEMISMRSDMKWHFSDEISAVEGIYNEGFGEKFIPVTHKRRALFFKKGLKGSHPFAIIIDRYSSDYGADHEFSTSYQMTTAPYTVDGKVYTADHGNGVTMSVIGSIAPTVKLAQKTPYFIGWRKRSGADSEDFEHYPAPCLQYIKNGVSARTVTALYPSDNGQVAIADISAGEKINDTDITLTFADGSVITLNENDYPCSLDSAERL